MSDTPTIVKPDGTPAVRLKPGSPCPYCGAPGKKVTVKFGGGSVCVSCGNEED